MAMKEKKGESGIVSPNHRERLTPRRLKRWIGRELGASQWFAIDQARINAFAEAAEDRQWIHVDPERAARGPNRGTVAHGFLLLGLLPKLLQDLPLFQGRFRMAVNYGLDRVRFIRPVRPGDRIRTRAVLREIRRKGFRRFVLKIDNTIEVEGGEEPAAIAELLAYFVL
jgi:acyl dehydratase